MIELLVFSYGFIIVALIVASHITLAAQIRAIPQPKVGRPRGSRNAPKPQPTLVEQAQSYFGPPPGEKKPIDPEELAALVRYVNEGDIAARDEMIDPNDEMRIGTGYAGT